MSPLSPLNQSPSPPPQGPNEADMLYQILRNYQRILMLVTSYMPPNPRPTAQQIDALVTVIGQTPNATQLGLQPLPKPTYTMADETYQWMEYQQFIIQQMEVLRIQLAESSGPQYYSSSCYPHGIGYGGWGGW